jgi:hypothetical protein
MVELAGITSHCLLVGFLIDHVTESFDSLSSQLTMLLNSPNNASNLGRQDIHKSIL